MQLTRKASREQGPKCFAGLFVVVSAGLGVGVMFGGLAPPILSMGWDTCEIQDFRAAKGAGLLGEGGEGFYACFWLVQILWYRNHLPIARFHPFDCHLASPPHPQPFQEQAPCTHT